MKISYMFRLKYIAIIRLITKIRRKKKYSCMSLRSET